MKLSKCLTLCLIPLMAIFSGCGGSTKGRPSKYEAYYVAQEFVKENLKAPATAKFPVANEATIIQLSDSIYVVKGYVDAQNSFGALIRSYYVVNVRHIGNSDWTLESVSIE